MRIWKPRDCVQIRLFVKQNGETDQNEPTPLVTGTKATGKEHFWDCHDIVTIFSTSFFHTKIEFLLLFSLSECFTLSFLLDFLCIVINRLYVTFLLKKTNRIQPLIPLFWAIMHFVRRCESIQLKPFPFPLKTNCLLRLNCLSLLSGRFIPRQKENSFMSYTFVRGKSKPH